MSVHHHHHHHGHHHHDGDAMHGSNHQRVINNLLLALGLNLIFSCIEIVGGIWTGSIAILADALHDLATYWRWRLLSSWKNFHSVKQRKGIRTGFGVYRFFLLA